MFTQNIMRYYYRRRKILFLLQIWSVVLTLRGCDGERALRIVGGGGKEASAQYSWVVRLVQHKGEVPTCGRAAGDNSYGIICSGSLLNHNWVLAAGHCADASHVQLNTQPAARGAGDQAVLFRKILKAHVHPAYMYQDTFSRSRGRLENDIALYETEEISMKSYGKLDCRDFPALFGREVYFLGYGLTKYANQYEDSKEKDKELKSGPLKYGTGLMGDCATTKYHGSLQHLSMYFNFCVMRKCSGFALLSERDMGGPVVVDDKVTGINTVIIEERKEGPSEDFVSVVATPISPYIDWINSLAKKSSTDFY